MLAFGRNAIQTAFSTCL